MERLNMSNKIRKRLIIASLLMGVISVLLTGFQNGSIIIFITTILLLLLALILFLSAIFAVPSDVDNETAYVDNISQCVISRNNNKINGDLDSLPYNEKAEKSYLNDALDETIKIYNQLANNSKINDMVNNFIEVIDQRIFTDFRNNIAFLKQYLQKTPLGNLFFEKLQLSDDVHNMMDEVYLSFTDVYDTQAFAIFNDLLCKETQIDPKKINVLSYLLLQKTAINKYSQLWQEKYHKGKLKEESLDEYVYRCFGDDNIDCQDDYGSILLAYYLLKQKNDIYTVFACEFISVKKTIRKFKEEKYNDLLKKQILIGNSKNLEKNPELKLSIDDVDLMTGKDFEAFICMLYQKMGYVAHVTQATRDQGLDVIAEKNNKRIGVQAKCYGSVVGNSAIQEAVAGKNYYNCERVAVITNNYFTKAAVELAKVNNVVLWDRNILKEKMKELL